MKTHRLRGGWGETYVPRSARFAQARNPEFVVPPWQVRTAGSTPPAWLGRALCGRLPSRSNGARASERCSCQTRFLAIASVVLARVSVNVTEILAHVFVTVISTVIILADGPQRSQRRACRAAPSTELRWPPRRGRRLDCCRRRGAENPRRAIEYRGALQPLPLHLHAHSRRRRPLCPFRRPSLHHGAGGFT